MQWTLPDFEPCPFLTNDARSQKKISLPPYDPFSNLWPTSIDNTTYQYFISAFTSSISGLVLTGQNSFIHHVLYPHLPSASQDLLCVCSLYMHKTPFNSAAVFQILATKRHALIANTQVIHTVEDWLLAVQAMICYTFILQFDPDIHQHLHSNPGCDSEAGLGMLELWTNTLQQKFFEAEINSLTLNSPWILLESIRRTVLVSTILQYLYASASFGFSVNLEKLKVLPVSKDVLCWNWGVDTGGESEAHELLSGGVVGARHAVVTYLDFVRGFNAECGKGRDLDGLGLGEYEALLLRVCPYSSVGRD